MSDLTPHWDDDLAAVYRQLAAIAVPHRAEQIATLLSLMPFGVGEPFRVVELASGEGYLADAILRAYPKATLLALDYAESMREATATRLEPHAGRGTVGTFNMFDTDWYAQVEGADVVVSSLCVHHLNGAQKQAMFEALQGRIGERGALLIADILDPKGETARALFAATYDEIAKRQSAKIQGVDLYAMFLEETWNHFDHPSDDDQPSPLFEQLLWLRNAGLGSVDCYWMNAGHAIFGGYQQTPTSAGIAYDAALEIAQLVLTV